MMKVAVILALTIPCVLGDCNLGWTEFEGMCYGISDEELNWFDAASMCNIYGGNLIEIKSRAEQDYISDQLTKRTVVDAWIGGTSRFHHSIWEWLPSFRSLESYTNWEDGQPDNPDIDLCIQVYSGFTYKWVNENCMKLINYVCEKKAQHGIA